MNVLVYVLDALRADHCSCYGYERETTPTIDGLAEDGVGFEQCVAPATWTRPVAASLSTGLYPPAHGTRLRTDRFDPPRAALAEQFAEAGFETVGVTAMGNVSSSTGFDRGFETFFNLYTDPDIVEKRSTSTATDEELTEEEGRVALPRAEDVTDAFGEWLDEREGDRPFFGFCWSIEPHIPYDPPGEAIFRDPEYDGPVDGSRESLKAIETDADLDQLRALYDEEIRYNDAWIGELVGELQDAGDYEDTLLVIVGDHGDAFEEHGRLTHGHTPHEELVRVPWVVRTPNEVGGHVATAQVSLVDLYATLLDYVTEHDLPDAPPTVAGQSNAAALDGEAIDGHEQVFVETKSYDMQSAFYGVRTPEWKYIEVDEPSGAVSTWLEVTRYVLRKGILLDILRTPRYYWRRYRYDETTLLYHLVADPEEQENLARHRPEICEEFATALEDWFADCAAYRDARGTYSDEGEIDERTKEQLRELGYVE